MDNVCERCGGEGVLPGKDEFTLRQCICAYRRAMRIHLGPEIVGATAIYESPIYTPSTTSVPVVDNVSKNLLLTGSWKEILPHIRLALVAKGLRFRFRITTDEKLKGVYLGKEAYGSRSRKDREDIETFNSLGDFGGGDFDLLIIRLGFLGYKNIAMPGILKEMLLLREASQKPTWLTDSHSVPFAPGHRAWNEEVGDYVDHNFTRLDLACEIPSAPAATAEPERRTEVVEEVNLPTEEADEPLPQDSKDSIHFGNDDIAGPSKKPWKAGGAKSSWKKKSGGGGPV